MDGGGGAWPEYRGCDDEPFVLEELRNGRLASRSPKAVGFGWCASDASLPVFGSTDVCYRYVRYVCKAVHPRR